MHSEHLLVAIAAVLVLGVSAQWLAWKLRLPSILLLLACGFLAGPITGFIDPQALQGSWVFAFVSLAVGVILFEGGLNLRRSELVEVGSAVRNLITIGVLVTWVLAGLAAYFLLGMRLELAVLTGAILTVTGPTVVTPLLRHIRPTGRAGTVAKWEGIAIDPIGAILAVLVLEAILLVYGVESEGLGDAALHALAGLVSIIVVSVAISVLGAATLVVLLRRRLIPDYLLSSIALVVVVAAFAGSNVLKEESGLLTTTLMGIMLANQRMAPVKRIAEFKEDLQVLLIGTLFIVLSARLELDVLAYFNWRTVGFLAAIIFVIRPIAVIISSIGTQLDWKDQAFLSWLAPRGIVAASVASLFAFRLQVVFPQDADALVPIVFFVIVATVAVYGLTAAPLAKYLGLAEPNAQGVLILGAHGWARQLAKSIIDLGFKVLMLDSNYTNVERARREHIPAERANVLTEDIVDELDLNGIGRLLALTPNDEVNSLAALTFREIFESTQVYQLATKPDARSGEGEMPRHLRGRKLFGSNANFASMAQRFAKGATVKSFDLTEDFPLDALKERYGDDLTLLFLRRGDEKLSVFADGHTTEPLPGDRLVALVPSLEDKPELVGQVPFEQLVTRASVIDVDRSISYEQLVARSAAVLSKAVSIPAEDLAQALLEGPRYGAAPIARGVALPHIRLTGIKRPELLLARCRGGVRVEPEHQLLENSDESQLIHAFFFLLSPKGRPNRHLRLLANIASCIDEEDFLDEWRAAENEQELKETLLHHDRFLSLHISSQTGTSDFIGKMPVELALPVGSHLALIQRGEEIQASDNNTTLEDGDRITIIGSPASIHRLYNQYRDSLAAQDHA